MKKAVEVLVIGFIVVLVILLIGFPTMWLWNWLMPMIFGLIKITFWQAIGLLMLCNILFNFKQGKQ